MFRSPAATAEKLFTDERCKELLRDFVEEVGPRHLYADTTLRKFRDGIRELFLSRDATLARNYLRFLVKEITVEGSNITIPGKTDAVVALMANGSETFTTLNHSDPVHISVAGWRPRDDSNVRPTV